MEATLETAFSEAVTQYEMIRPGERVLVALSGGPDSVCLFHLLVALRDSLDLELGVAHVNHGLRGMESDDEERFVRELAASWGIPCFVHTEDVAQTARRRGVSFEQAARQVRYGFFEELMRLESYDKTALAHHMNDQVETILHRLVRGAGLNGLAGMRPVRDGRWIRPLLAVSRSRILAWLESNHLPYRLDSSNDSREYTRNRIRLDLIPQLETFNPDLISTIGAMSRSLQWDRDHLEAAAGRLAAEHIHRLDDKVVIRAEGFRHDRAMTSRLVFLALEQLQGHRLDLTARQVEDILALQAGATGRSLDLPGRITVYNHYGQLEWSFKEDRPGEPEEPTELRVDLEGLPLTLEFPPYTIALSHDAPDGSAGRVDAAALTRTIIIRRRREQDRMRTLGMGGHKKVRQIFMDRRIHRGIRDRLPVFTDENGEIFYIYPGICGEAYRITQNTDKILYITVTENY